MARLTKADFVGYSALMCSPHGTVDPALDPDAFILTQHGSPRMPRLLSMIGCRSILYLRAVRDDVSPCSTPSTLRQSVTLQWHLPQDSTKDLKLSTMHPTAVHWHGNEAVCTDVF